MNVGDVCVGVGVCVCVWGGWLCVGAWVGGGGVSKRGEA